MCSALVSTMTLLSGCGSEPAEPTDLTGTWVSEESEGSYQEAVISNDTIEINWVTPDSKAIYWIGSYEAPTEAVDEYSWTSSGDTEKMASALLDSQDELKDFKYKDGVISYDASMMGVTKTVELKKQ